MPGRCKTTLSQPPSGEDFLSGCSIWSAAVPATTSLRVHLNCRQPFASRPHSSQGSLYLWLSGEVGIEESESRSVVSDSATWWTIQSMEFTGVCRLSLLQGIFPTQGSNPGLPHYRRILYQLNHQGGLGMERLRYLGSTGATLRGSSWAWLRLSGPHNSLTFSCAQTCSPLSSQIHS